MGKFNRQQRRKIEKECWRANVKVDDIQAQAVKDVQADVSHKTAGLLIHAMSLVLMQNFKTLQKKDTRLDNFVSLIHQKIKYIKEGQFTREDNEILNTAHEAFNAWFNNHPYQGGEKNGAQ